MTRKTIALDIDLNPFRDSYKEIYEEDGEIYGLVLDFGFFNDKIIKRRISKEQLENQNILELEQK